MHPGFVANLDNALNVRKQLRRSADDRILGIPRQIGVVEVDQVVIADPSRWVAPVEHVPYRLEDRPCCQPPVRDVQPGGLLEQSAVDGIALYVLQEPIALAKHDAHPLSRCRPTRRSLCGHGHTPIADVRTSRARPRGAVKPTHTAY